MKEKDNVKSERNNLPPSVGHTPIDTDPFYDGDPDEYMYKYYGSLASEEDHCNTCAHRNGASCESSSGACEYKAK